MIKLCSPLITFIFDPRHHLLFFQINTLILKIILNFDVIEPPGDCLSFHLPYLNYVFNWGKYNWINYLWLDINNRYHSHFEHQLDSLSLFELVDVFILSNWIDIRHNYPVFVKSKNFRNVENLVIILLNKYLKRKLVPKI